MCCMRFGKVHAAIVPLHLGVDPKLPFEHDGSWPDPGLRRGCHKLT